MRIIFKLWRGVNELSKVLKLHSGNKVSLLDINFKNK